jgi:MFS family permease
MRLSEHERPTRTHFAILGMAWAGWLFDFYDLILYTFLLGPISADLGFDRGVHAWILGASLGATAVGGLVFGALADRYGRKSVLQWTILTYSAGAFACGLAGSAEWLLAARVLTGLGVGGEWATGHALVSEVFPPRLRGRFGAVMQTGAPLGVGLAAIVGSFVAPHIGWRAVFMLSALPALLVTAIRRWVPESDVWLASHAAAATRPSILSRMGDILRAPTRSLTLRCFLLTVCNMSSYWLTFSWFPTYLREDRGISTAKSGLWILLIVAGELTGYLTFGAVSDRLGRKPAFSIYAGMMGAGLMAVTLGWDLIAASPPLLLASMAVVGIGTGTWSNSGPYLSELFPTRIRNTAMGAIYNGARGIQFVTPLAVHAISVQYRLSGGIAMAALFCFAASALVWSLPETRGKILGGEADISGARP